jgi:type I restriction enzyme S subunit
MNRWPTKPLGEVAEFINGRAFKPTDWSTKGIPIIRIQNLTDPTASANRFEGAFEERHAVKDGDLLISWSATLDVFFWNRGDAILNQHIFRAVPDSAQISKTYLFYALKSVMDELRSKTHGATMKHITKGPFEKTLIPVPPLVEQERIVKLLDEADELRKLRAQADRRSAELIPSLFHQMFGENQKRGVARMKLEQTAEVVSGVAKGRKFHGRQSVEVPYLRVANVQAGHLNLSEIKMIQALPEEVAALALRKGDVLLTEGGDFDKLGRGAMLEQELPNCIHQNHVFRVRVERAKLEPIFFAEFLLTAEAKGYFLSCAKRTTNLASINMRQLRALPVPVPPLTLQKEFARRVIEIREFVAAQTGSRNRIGNLFHSMLHRAFAGEL